MQRIQEEYGAIFEHLARNHTRMAGNSNLGKNGIIDLSPPALKHVRILFFCFLLMLICFLFNAF